MCSWPTAAAARASRANRRRAVAPCARDGCEHLDRHRPIEGRVARLEHHAHSPLPQDLEHLVGPEPAQGLGPVGIRRIEEPQPGALLSARIVVVLIVLDRRRGARPIVGRPDGSGSLAQQPGLGPELARRGEPLQLLRGRTAHDSRWSASSACSGSVSRSSRERRRRWKSQRIECSAMIVLPGIGC